MTHPACFATRRPPDDDRSRLVCGDCGFVDYQNPKVIVATIARWEGQVLLCRRAIEPSLGLWTLPAGHLERGETAEEGALRETREETRALVAIDGLLGVYSTPEIAQVEIVYTAQILYPEFGPTPESSEVRLFEPREIPWDELAFDSVRWALERWLNLASADAPTATPLISPDDATLAS